MPKYNITINARYRRVGGFRESDFSHHPQGCYSGPYSYRLSGDDLYFSSGAGEEYIGPTWNGYEITEFSVEEHTLCEEEEEELKYDCLNASCVLATTYNTSGIYTLAECEMACGSGCSGKCISNEEWNKIQSLANQLKNKSCN